MFPLKILAGALLALSLAACQQTTPASKSSSAAISRSLPADTELNSSGLPLPDWQDQPERLRESGDYEHRFTGLIFPAKAGSFKREHLIQYDVGGMDVSANYAAETGQGRIIASAYIYPVTSMAPDVGPYDLENERLCRDIFDGTTKSAQSVFVKPWLKETSQTSDVFIHSMGYRALFEAEGHRAAPGSDIVRAGDSALTSEIYLFCKTVPLSPVPASDSMPAGSVTALENFWHIKYRITYPQGVDARALIDKWMWSVPTRM